MPDVTLPDTVIFVEDLGADVETLLEDTLVFVEEFSPTAFNYALYRRRKW